MYYTYVLQSDTDKKLYVGFTYDMKNRLKAHQDGAVRSTASRRPLKLIYYEACLVQDDALRREKFLKFGYGRRFLKGRLESYLNL
jgi:putative endonuclease